MLRGWGCARQYGYTETYHHLHRASRTASAALAQRDESQQRGNASGRPLHAEGCFGGAVGACLVLDILADPGLEKQ